MLIKLVEILMPTFASAFAGLIWVRSGRAFDRKMVGDLIALIGAPCLVFSTLVSLEVSPQAMLEMALAASSTFAAFGIVGFVFLRIVKLPIQDCLAPLIFGNHGNMGIPLCLFAFGVEGKALALVFFAIGASLQFSVGLFIWSGRIDPIELVRNPIGLAAVFNYLLAQRYQRSPEQVASLVVVSTMLAAATLPLLLSFLL